MREHEWDIAGTCRSADKKDFYGSLFPLPFDGTQATEEICDALNKATHLLISIPPQPSGDVVLKNFGSKIAECEKLKWIGYISSTGVYGDTQGKWVDESASTQPVTKLNMLRVEAENQWLNMAKEYFQIKYRGSCVLIFSTKLSL